MKFKCIAHTQSEVKCLCLVSCGNFHLAPYLSGAVLGNVLAEAPERLSALSKQQQLQEEPEVGTVDVETVDREPEQPQYKRPRYKPRYKAS